MIPFEKDPFELATRNTVEVVTDEDLRNVLGRLKTTRGYEQQVLPDAQTELIEKPQEKPRAYVGYEPSGEIHLGHLVTFNKLMDLAEVGFQPVVLLADLHAFLNRKGSLEEVREITKSNKKIFEALRRSKNKDIEIKYFTGSKVQFKKEYEIQVLKLAQQITLNRAQRSMDEVGRQMEYPTVSQMIYPIMQMVDIAQLKVDVAVGGIDQRKIHMLAREYLPKVNMQAPVCIHTPILLGLDGKKMSSSMGNYISVRESEEGIRNKIKNAFCPQGSELNQENPILQIFQYHIFPWKESVTVKRPEKFGGDRTFGTYEEIALAYAKGEVHPMDLKVTAAGYLVEILRPVRERLS